MSKDQSNVDDVISEVDSLLSEEDPDFIEQLGQIKIDNAMADLSLMDQVLNNVSPEKKSFVSTIKSLFDLKNNASVLIPFWGLIIIITAAVVFVVKMNTWNKPDSLFLTSYAELPAEIHSYNPVTESEMFFDNSRLLKNIVAIKKMVANIKSSETSGANPMLAFELNIEGMTSEVIIEIKDREAEFKDLILRVAEESNYDTLLKSEGKQILSENILNVINANLTQGQIRKVLYKSFILKN